MSEWKLNLRLISPKMSSLVFNGPITEAAKYVIVKALDDDFDDVVKQRDELLAALIIASVCLEPNTSKATVNQIESAIARVKGGAA